MRGQQLVADSTVELHELSELVQHVACKPNELLVLA